MVRRNKKFVAWVGVKKYGVCGSRCRSDIFLYLKIELYISWRTIRRPLSIGSEIVIKVFNFRCPSYIGWFDVFFRLGTNFEIFKCPLSIRRRHRTPLLISFSLTLLCMSKIEPVLCESFVVTWSLINRTSRPNSLMCLCVKHPDEPDLLTPTLWCACWLDKCDSASVFFWAKIQVPRFAVTRLDSPVTSERVTSSDWIQSI